jgi:Tfp pilus assembly protein PilO
MAAKGQNQLIEKFAKLTPAAKVGVFVAVAALLGGAYWYLFYGDLSEELNAGRSKAKALAKEKDTFEERQKQYRDLLEKKKAIEDGLKANQIALPATSELPSFFVSLQSQAIAANVTLVQWSRQTEVPVETYVKVPVAITVTGDFYQILEYFKLLYETRRIITVEDLLINQVKRDKDRVTMTASFTASTFRQADTPPQEAAPGAKDGKDGKDGKAEPGKDGKAPAGKDAPAGAKEKGK